MKNTDVRGIIGFFFQSSDFAVECANLMKPADQQIAKDDWQKIAMSLPRLYAVVEAAEITVSVGFADDIESALQKMVDGEEKVLDIANRCARLAWQAQQPLLGRDRLGRPIMGCTSGSLPEGELEKDIVRVKATADLLLKKLRDY